uniref:DUF148 domain-containing protein n=1 Tax=Strongyloides venezuelensis TaxID=75913 RepID=A0A0K0FXT3_STRVS
MKFLILVITFIALSSAMVLRGMNVGEPGFMEKMSQEGKEKLKELMEDDSKTKAETDNAINNIIANESEEVKKEFEEVKAKKEQFKNELKTKFQDTISKLSPEAQNVVSQIESIHNDTNITLKQEIEQIKEVIAKETDEAIKAKLKELKKNIFKHNIIEKD